MTLLRQMARITFTEPGEGKSDTLTVIGEVVTHKDSKTYVVLLKGHWYKLDDPRIRKVELGYKQFVPTQVLVDRPIDLSGVHNTDIVM